MASAIEVACLQEPCPIQIAAVLLRHYSGLQNIPPERRDLLNPLVKKAPDAFLEAAKEIALAGGHTAHSSWLASVITTNRGDPAVQEALFSHLPQWLARHSLSLDPQMMIGPGDSADKVAAERARVTERLEKKF